MSYSFNNIIPNPVSIKFQHIRYDYRNSILQMDFKSVYLLLKKKREGEKLRIKKDSQNLKFSYTT